jgi:hypothetical protein
MSATQDPMATRPTLAAAGSRQMIDAAVAEAESMGVPVTIVVVDESGVTKRDDRRGRQADRRSCRHVAGRMTVPEDQWPASRIEHEAA